MAATSLEDLNTSLEVHKTEFKNMKTGFENFVGQWHSTYFGALKDIQEYKTQLENYLETTKGHWRDFFAFKAIALGDGSEKSKGFSERINDNTREILAVSQKIDSVVENRILPIEKFHSQWKDRMWQLTFLVITLFLTNIGSAVLFFIQWKSNTNP